MITNKKNDVAFRNTHRGNINSLDRTIEEQEICREEVELEIIQARLHYENSFHVLSRIIVNGEHKEYEKYLKEFKEASDKYHKLNLKHSTYK